MTIKALDAGISVATPEGVVLYAPLADPLCRMWALLIDIMILLAGLWLLLMGVGLLFSRAALGIGAVLAFLLIWGYFFIGEYFFSGKTFGKKIIGIQVLCSDLTPVSVQAALWRNVLRYIDFLPGCFGVGLCFILFSPRHQRLGDWMAGTVVVMSPPPVAMPKPINVQAEPPPWVIDHEGQLALLAFARYINHAATERSEEIAEVFAKQLPHLSPAARVAKLQAYAAWFEQGKPQR